MATSRWTNQSVRQLAGNRDPVDVIVEHSRRVVLEAMEGGWAGPPFDPVALADILGIQISPNDSVPDARTIPLERNRLLIEFNPSRPRGRMRYSLAHEIAHTFFPDCADRVRHRSPHGEEEPTGWQLEALCNIAASELLMPIGSIGEAVLHPDVEGLLAERQRFDVSTEAIFIRAARVSSEPMATFCSSIFGSGKDKGRYRLDYAIGSNSWRWSALQQRGALLPTDTAAAQCSGIGFTARGEETWGSASHARRVHVECVGIPPYPGSLTPRVVGIVREADHDRASSPQARIEVVRGDATQPRGQGPRMIVQVVNDETPNWGGGGFAAAVKRAFPEVQKAFREWWPPVSGGRRRLGQVHIARVSDDISIGSIVAQHGYGESKTPRVRYLALRDGLARIASEAAQIDASVHMPRIGCGQAGGAWPVVEELIRDTLLAAGRTVTVYDRPGAPPPVKPHQGAFDLLAPS